MADAVTLDVVTDGEPLVVDVLVDATVSVQTTPPVVDVVTVDPPGGGGYQPRIHRQTTPQATTDIVHGLARPGPVAVHAYSLDGTIEYWNFTVQTLDDNTLRVSFDDPITFIATIF